MNSKKQIRCAVYTRKSTEHNLDLEFNSLDAQREACEAYIRSQIHEGWRLVPARYDDGGISGASLERPDLQRLLEDIRAGRVDTVVVYKVDRLTRSLTDFAKLVELFDAHNVSFVSVTQSFNTTSSMGRLTLNVLLSFAQFEREVIGERVRDKVAASKRKGLWMGGNPPLGYINQEKKLVVVPDEAEKVRWIFERYLEVGSVGQLLKDLNDREIRTKVKRRSKGATTGGARFGKGALVYLLKNRAYIGELTYRDEVHQADHEPILDRETFRAVQTVLAANGQAREARLKASPYLLTGLIFDSAGNRMSPTHTDKKGVRYRYYVSQAILQARPREAGEIERVSAPDIEALAVGQVRRRVQGQPISPADREFLKSHVHSITVLAEALRFELLPDPTSEEGRPEFFTVPWTRKQTVAAKGLITGPEQSLDDPKAREAVLTAIGKARAWVEEMVAGTTVAAIAAREGKCERHIRLLAPLAFIPPQTVKGLIDGNARSCTVTELAKNVPLIWN